MGLNTYPYSPFPASTDQLHKGDNEQIQVEIDEINGDIVSLENDISTLDNQVNGDAVTYPYADVITIEDAVPANVADCSVKIEPAQSGSGDPSPENIRPITGHSSVVVTRAGQNMAGELTQGYYSTADGTATSSNEWVRTAKIVCMPNHTYKLLSKHLTRWVSCCVYDSNGDFIEVLGEASGSSAHKVDVTVKVPNNAYYMGWSIANPVRPTPLTPSDITDLMLFDTATYSDYTISIGDNIYGGTVDFDSGVMTVDRAMLTLDGTEQGWSTDTTSGGKRRFSNAQLPSLGYTSTAKIRALSNIFKNTISSDYDLMDNVFILRYVNGANRIDIMTEQFADVTEWTTFLGTTNMQVLYMLATPTTIQLTPQQIQLLQGQNTLTASTGDISITANGVSGAIGSLQTQANATDEALAELAADIADQLPTAPTTDGAYVLTVTVESGTPTYSWESAE